MHVYGAQICGDKYQSTTFVPTGRVKGYYPVHVCTKPPHSGGSHHDKNTGKSWN
jgi:hypothetical protein